MPHRTMLALALLLGAQAGRPPAPFTADRILSLPTPDNLTAAPTGSAIAWTFDERGVRNVYVALAPQFGARRVTAYSEDDGQELTNLSFSQDGQTLVYVRGGDHGSGRGDAPNPASSSTQPKVQVWAVAAAGGTPHLLGDGDDPEIAPDGRRVAFVRDRRIMVAPIDGAKQADAAFFARGTSESPRWSPDGRTLAFVLNRGDHSFIGLATPSQPIRFIAPSTTRDSEPKWSPDGKQIAFIRQPGTGGTPRLPLAQSPPAFSLMIADVDTPDRAFEVAGGGHPPTDRIIQNPGGLGFWWAAANRLAVLLYRDGWPHLYSVEARPNPHPPQLLTPGSFMVEQVALTPDGRFAIYNANTGPDRADVDRRHLFKVALDGSAPPSPLTAGQGIEWSPVVTRGEQVAYLSAETRRPPLPAIVPLAGGSARLVAADHVPPAFPTADLIDPESVSFRASDGVEAHGQLFVPRGTGRKPAVVYVHGGGPRQMLLGWHYRWEYANDYGANQLLASRGFVVLAVNYRLSVGYGQAFQFAERAGPRGASEDLDVLAAGRYLQGRSDVDPRRIGVWGASYGGYLTALALGRHSDVFAAGVDLHGVHDRIQLNPAQLARAAAGDGPSEAEWRQALKVQFESSPIAAVPTWKSPVLLIHGDDDRTVDFHQTVDLERRLQDKGVRVESLVLPDEVHDALLWRNWVKSIDAMSEFFERNLSSK